MARTTRPRRARSDKAQMLTWIERALELGKAAAQFRADSDFSRYHDDYDFTALLDSVEG